MFCIEGNTVYRKTLPGIFVFYICVNMLIGCMPYKPYHTSRLEYPGLFQFKFGKHDLSAESKTFKEKLLKKIAFIAEKHLYEAIECSDAKGVEMYTPVSCYKQKEKHSYIVASYDPKMYHFLILISWRGVKKDPSILQVKADFERELKYLLGRPLKRSP